MIIALTVGMVFLVSTMKRGHMRPPFAPLLVIGAVALGIGLIIREHYRTATPTVPPRTASPATPVANERVASKKKWVHQVKRGPPAQLAIPPLSERLPGLFYSMGLAAVVASILGAGVYVALAISKHSSVMPSIEHAVAFSAVTVMGSWMILLGNALTCGSDWTSWERFVTRIFTGAALGTCAYGFQEFLFLSTDRSAYTVMAGIRNFGNYTLVDPMWGQTMNSTWLGFACFFGAWMGLRRWSRDTNPLRRRRYSIGLTAGAVALGFVASMIFRFPQWYAMLWAGTLSTTVQLVSAWTPAQPPTYAEPPQVAARQA
jgi:hypothetical protein